MQIALNSLFFHSSPKGIGEMTAVTLLAELPELGNISDQAGIPGPNPRKF